MRIVVLAVVLALALAGCVGTSDSSSSSNQTGTASGATTASGTSSQAGATSKAPTGSASTSSSAPTSSGAPAANRAPSITLLAADVTAGAAPLAVSLALNATDADKDALTYTLGFGDGTADATGALPSGNVTHTFAAAGNYTVKFTVSDGKVTVNKTLLVTAIAATGGASVTLTGTVLTPDPIASIPDGFCANDLLLDAATAGTLGETHGVAAYVGWAYVLAPAGVLAWRSAYSASSTSFLVPVFSRMRSR